MGQNLQRTVALAATTLVACSLFVDTSGFVSDDAVDAQAESGAEAAATSDAAVDGHEAIEDGATDAPPPADVLVDGPVDASVCPPPPNDPSLKGWYLFDEGSGTTITDCSTSQRHGLQANGTWTTGKKGGGLSFNGTTCVTLPAGLSLLNGFTIAAWISVVSFEEPGGNSRYIASKSNSSYKGWAFKVDTPPHYEVTLGQGGTTRIDLSTSGAQPANVWTHVVAVWLPSSRYEIWVNGVKSIASATPPASLVDDLTAPPRIGCRNGVHFFSGVIDDVKIWDRALTEQEIPPLAE